MSSESSRGRQIAVASGDFRRVCGRYASGVTVVTTVDAGAKPHGLTVSSFTSVSLTPPLVLVCVGHSASTLAQFHEAKYFGINILADFQQAISDRFARKAGDRFDGFEWRPGSTGVPLLDGVLGSLECGVHQIVPMGDHDILVGEVLAIQVHTGKPLIHFSGEYRTLA